MPSFSTMLEKNCKLPIAYICIQPTVNLADKLWMVVFIKIAKSFNYEEVNNIRQVTNNDFN